MTEVNAFIPSHFADLYVSFLTNLLEANPKGLPEIYEFSFQYFENKLKERSGETKKNNERLFQRDVPNSRGKKQFLPDFSYDSVLILHPKLSSQVTSPEKNMENLLNKEKQVMRHLNDSTSQQKQERNLPRKLQTFQENEEMNRLTNQDIGQYERNKAFSEDQEKLQKERENDRSISYDERQETRNGSLNKDSRVTKEQEIILDLENILKEENQVKLMDYDGYERDNFKMLFKDLNVLDKASNTEVDQGPFRKRFCTAHQNHSAVPQEKNIKHVPQKEEQIYHLEKQNTLPLELHENRMKLQKMRTPEMTKTFVDAQFSIGNEVLNQIVEFSKLLPTCLEVMAKMLNDLDERHRSPKDDSCITSNRREVQDYLPETLEESCENDTDKQNTSDKIFGTTSSQTDFVGSLELMNINNSVLTTAMFEYVCDVVKAAKHLLHSVTVKGNNHLPVEKITDGLFMFNESNNGFNEFQKILDFWKDFLDKPENGPFRMDQNHSLESLEKEYAYNQRDPEEDKNPCRYESNEEPENCQFHRKSNSDHDLDKDLRHSSEHQTTEDTNGCTCSQIQQDISQISGKCCDKCDPSERSTREKDQSNSNSNESCSDKESTNHSSIEIQKLLDGITDFKIGYSKDNLSKSLSDTVISSLSNQDEYKNALTSAFLLKLEEIYQINEYDDPFFRSSPCIMQVSANVPSPKGMEKIHKSTGDLSLKQKAGRLKPEKLSDGKTEHKNKGFFSLLERRRSTTRNEKENMKKLLNYYKIHDSKYTKDQHRQHNNTKIRRDLKNSPETDEDIKENDQPSLSDSGHTGPINTDSSPFFISTPFTQHLSKSILEKEIIKYTGDPLEKQTLQVYKNYGRSNRKKRKFPAKDELQDPKLRGLFSLLDPKRSLMGRKETSYKKLRTADVASTTVEAEIDNKDNTKLVVHEIHQATSKLQMRILKCRRVYKEAMSKTGTNRGVKDLDDNWRDTSVPVTGRNWLRSYFTTRMIRRYQKQLETDKIDNETEDLATPMLKHQECNYGLGSYFSQRSLFGSVRIWYFSKKLREYQKVSNL